MIRKCMKNFSLCKISVFDYDKHRLGVMNLQFSEIWSVSDERIRAFFLGQNDVRQKEENCFACGRCEICLTPLPPRQIGRFRFPQTRVEFCGPEEDAEEIHRRFVLQFIYAGG